MRYLLFLSLFTGIMAYEKDMTIMVQAGKVDCFYHKVLLNEIIDIEYQEGDPPLTLKMPRLEVKHVSGLHLALAENCSTRILEVIDSTHGDLDVSFQLSDPGGRKIVADYKKPENSHRHTALLEGVYEFCFDNTFSTFSTKTVFFDILIDNDEHEERDYDDDKEMELGNSAETYMMKVKDISDSVSRVKERVSTARRLQELHSAHEARDRNLAEEMCDRVMNWSISQIFLMIFVGITQVIFVKSLFEDRVTFSRLIPGLSK